VARTEPPYRITTDRLVLRCWDPRDAPLVREAVAASVEHLRPWMPWARDAPRPLPEVVELLRRFRGQFDLGQDYVYGIFSRDESEVVGGSGLHTRVDDDAFEIGYWIRASRARQGLATEAAAALARVGFAVCGVDRIEIHADPSNAASLGVARKLGFAEEATLRRRLPSGDGAGPRDEVVFSLFRDEYERTPVAAARLDAYDSAGTPVALA
jgi:RimJ/RimL family protein N-acetyltransferase